MEELKVTPKTDDPVSPSHYRSHPSGIECIEISRHLPSDLGQALQYVWRWDTKNGVEDLRKARWFLRDQIDYFGEFAELSGSVVLLLSSAARAEYKAARGGLLNGLRGDFLQALSEGFLDKALHVVELLISYTDGGTDGGTDD